MATMGRDVGRNGGIREKKREMEDDSCRGWNTRTPDVNDGEAQVRGKGVLLRRPLSQERWWCRSTSEGGPSVSTPTVRTAGLCEGVCDSRVEL